MPAWFGEENVNKLNYGILSVLFLSFSTSKCRVIDFSSTQILDHSQGRLGTCFFEQWKLSYPWSTLHCPRHCISTTLSALMFKLSLALENTSNDFTDFLLGKALVNLLSTCLGVNVVPHLTSEIKSCLAKPKKCYQQTLSKDLQPAIYCNRVSVKDAPFKTR